MHLCATVKQTKISPSV